MNGNVYENLEIRPEKIFGWNSTEPIFQALIEWVKPSVIIEVGTWLGASALHMAEEVCKAKLPCKIYCVDTWLGALEFMPGGLGGIERDLMPRNGWPEVYFQFLSNVLHRGKQDIIIPIPNTSSIAAKYFCREGIHADMIYIDASHEEEDVYRDIVDYYPILTKNGVIFGDDYSDDWSGVIKAVKRFSNDSGLKYQITGSKHWVIEKQVDE